MSNNYKTEVYCSFQLEGIHNWPDCPHDEVSYLRDPHRHQFFFKAWADVNHDDRDIEFIMMQHEVRDYITEVYYSPPSKACYFGAMSCEMIGRDLLDRFPFLTKVDVSEDNENGATVTRA